jgi:hypothetical protein
MAATETVELDDPWTPRAGPQKFAAATKPACLHLRKSAIHYASVWRPSGGMVRLVLPEKVAAREEDSWAMRASMLPP